MALIGPEGRRVRCAECRQVWRAGTPEADAPLPAPPVNPYAPPASPISSTGFEIDFDINRTAASASDLPSFHDIVREGVPKKKRGGVPGKKAVFAAIVTFAIVMGAFFALQSPLTAILPATASVYNGFGLKTIIPAEGAGIDRLILRPVRNEKGLNVEVSTKLLNLSDKSVALATILVEQIDPQGKALGPQWRFEPPKAMLRPGETAPFKEIVGPIAGQADTVQLRARYIN